MEWLHRKIDEFENKEAERKRIEAEKRAILERERTGYRNIASELLEKIYEYFLTVKEELDRRKYPCEVGLDCGIDAHTNGRTFKDVSLIVENSSSTLSKKVSSAVDPHITFKAIYGEANLAVEFRTSGQEMPTRSQIKFNITEKTIEEMTEKFITKLFSST